MGDTLGLPRSDLSNGFERTRRARTTRRVGLLLLAAICVAALVGLLGPMETTRSLASDEGELEVTYPRVVRPGMEISMTVRVQTDSESGGFSLAVDQTLFEDLQIDHVFPLPQSQTAEGDRMVYAFDSADGEATVLLRGRVPTQSPPTRTESTIALGDPRGATSEGIDLKVWVLP